MRAQVNLGILLSSAVLLKAADLHFDACEDSERYLPWANPLTTVMFETMFNGVAFKRLGELRLRGVSCAQTDFTSLLKNHAGSLRHLELDSLCLRGSGAKVFVQVIACITYELSLSSINLEGTWQGVAGQELLGVDFDLDYDILHRKILPGEDTDMYKIEQWII